MNHWSDEWPGVCHGAFHPRAGRVRRINRVIHSAVGLGGGYANVISSSVPRLESLRIHGSLLEDFDL